MIFKNSGRYSVPTDEDFEPNSKDIMDEIEQSELKRTELELLTIYSPDYQFKAEGKASLN